MSRIMWGFIGRNLSATKMFNFVVCSHISRSCAPPIKHSSVLCGVFFIKMEILLESFILELLYISRSIKPLTQKMNFTIKSHKTYKSLNLSTCIFEILARALLQFACICIFYVCCINLIVIIIVVEKSYNNVIIGLFYSSYQ